MQRIEVKATWTVDAAGAIEGFASIFDTVDRGGDIVRPGAFKGVSPPLPMLWDHNPAEPIGVWEVVQETAQGLLVKGRLLIADLAKAAEVRALILAQAVTGLSIGYIATKTMPRKGGGRDLVAVDLFEVSVVAVPMHPDTRITQAKANEAGKVTMSDLDPAMLQAMNDLVAVAIAAAMPKETKAADTGAAQLAARMDQIEAKANRLPAPAIVAPGELSAEKKAWAQYLRVGSQGLNDAERKTFMVSSDPQGGYLAQPEISGEIIRDLIEFSPIRSLASIAGTSQPSVIYTTRGLLSGAAWHGEVVTVPETTGNPFGQREIILRRLSTFVDISNQNLLFAPAAIAEVNAAIAEDFAKKESVSFVSGSGVLDPVGIMTNADIGYVPMLDAALITSDGLIKGFYKMPMTYRNKGTWVMNGTTLSAVRTLKDTTGNYLWQRSLQDGQPETLLGRPVVECLDMPDVGANTFPILYGDFSGYRIVDGLAMSMLVDPYSQAANQRTRIHATRMVGADVLAPFKFKKFKVSLT
ncbi:MAG: phage major capsid protein [Pseudomonadota bacterium]